MRCYVYRPYSHGCVCVCVCVYIYYAYTLWKESRLQKSGGPRLILPEKCYLFFFYFHYYLYFFSPFDGRRRQRDDDDDDDRTQYNIMIISAPFGYRRAIVGVPLQENPVERKTGAHRNI